MTLDIPVEGLTALCADVFERLGSGPPEARRVAASLVGANLTGHDSHGVIRLPRYVDWVRSGDILPKPDDRTHRRHARHRGRRRPLWIWPDRRAERRRCRIEKAKAAGLSAVSLRKCWTYRPGRRMGRDGGRRGADVDPFRERRWPRSLWRLSAVSKGVFRQRLFASRFRARVPSPLCSTSRPRSSQKARSPWRAAAASPSRKAPHRT